MCVHKMHSIHKINMFHVVCSENIIHKLREQEKLIELLLFYGTFDDFSQLILHYTLLLFMNESNVK